MSSSRFYSRTTDKAGPVIGSFFPLVLCFNDDGATGTDTFQHTVDLPPGMRFEIESIDVQANNITVTPSLTIGTAKAGAEIVAAVNVTAALGPLTLVATSIAAGGLISAQIVNAAADGFSAITVSIFGYVTEEPTSLAKRS